MIVTSSLDTIDYRKVFELDSAQTLLTDAACTARIGKFTFKAQGRLYLFDEYLCFRVTKLLRDISSSQL